VPERDPLPLLEEPDEPLEPDYPEPPLLLPEEPEPLPDEDPEPDYDFEPLDDKDTEPTLPIPPLRFSCSFEGPLLSSFSLSLTIMQSGIGVVPNGVYLLLSLSF
jgi:hypothetical protein